MNQINKIIVIVLLLAFTSLLHAETCPTIKAIRNHDYKKQGWDIYDASGNQANQIMQKMITEEATDFYSVFWNKSYSPYGQCFYKKDDQPIYTVFIGKNFKRPTGQHWQEFHGRPNVLTCTSKINECHF